MSVLDLLLLTSLLSIGVSWKGELKQIGWVCVSAYVVQFLLLLMVGTQLAMEGQQGLAASSFSFTAFGISVNWAMSGLGWFFALITLGSAIFAAWFSAGAWAESQNHIRMQHSLLALNVFAMLLLLSSADFLSLFIGWELVSWASFLIMTQSGGKAAAAAFRYLIYAMLGAVLILLGLVLIYVHTGSLEFAEFWAALPTLPNPIVWALFAVFSMGFAVKMGLMPFHLWQADAYAYTPGASAAFLGAISARMGLFAIAIVLLTPIGLERLSGLALPFSFLSAQGVLAWAAALTMIIPTYIALQQTDARLLLAWHGIGQGGFMLLGLAVGTPLSVAGGLLHVFNYATYQAALFLVVVAVMYRTGTANLDKLGGLITRMPWSYVVLLMGIIGLAGLPPMNGFVSKWMIYRSLLQAEMPMLLIAASISTLGTILSVYKLIHNIFLGQLRKEHYGVKDVPLSMLLPMGLLAGIGFLTGLMPGLALDLVDKAQVALGFATVPHHIGGFALETGGLNMLWVVGMIFYGFGIGAIIFFVFGNRRHITHQWDNYAGGHFLSADTPYHYSHNFYPGLMRVIGPWFRGWIVDLEQGLRHTAQILAGGFYTFYRTAYTPLYLLMVTVLAFYWAI